MSFGASNTAKQGMNNLGGISNTLQNQAAPAAYTGGTNLINTGGGNVDSGTNFWNQVLNGNRSATSALLQPQTDQIRQGQSATLNSINTLMPRGGARSSALFQQSFAPQQMIQNLFNQARMGAAQFLPQIGLQQQQLGTNLFGMGNQALSTAGNVSMGLTDAGQKQQQISNSMAAGLGSGIFKLLTTPFGGGAAMNGLLGKL